MIRQVEELAQQVSVSRACQALGMPRSSLYRAWAEKRQASKPVGREAAPSPRSLSAEEQANVRQVLNSERSQDQAPREVYATLLDEGQYLCHWRTMYRILAEHDEV